MEMASKAGTKLQLEETGRTDNLQSESITLDIELEYTDTFEDLRWKTMEDLRLKMESNRKRCLEDGVVELPAKKMCKDDNSLKVVKKLTMDLVGAAVERSICQRRKANETHNHRSPVTSQEEDQETGQETDTSDEGEMGPIGRVSGQLGTNVEGWIKLNQTASVTLERNCGMEDTLTPDIVIKVEAPKPHPVTIPGGFKCSVCDQFSTKKYNISTHILYVHTPVRGFICPLCEKTSANMRDLKRHQSKCKGKGQRMLGRPNEGVKVKEDVVVDNTNGGDTEIEEVPEIKCEESPDSHNLQPEKTKEDVISNNNNEENLNGDKRQECKDKLESFCLVHDLAASAMVQTAVGPLCKCSNVDYPFR